MVILAVLIILLIGFIFVLNMVERSIPKETVYPSSTLTDSIFESQNNEYTSSPDFEAEYYCGDIPYIIDVPNTGAEVGSNGSFFDFGNGVFYMYVSEYDKSIDDTGMNTMKEELSEALMMDSKTELTSFDIKGEGTGYINGFDAHYYTGILNITNSEQVLSVYLTAYNLEIPESDDYGIWISVISVVDSTENLNICKNELDIAVRTCRYDSTLDEEIQKRLQTAEEEDKQFQDNSDSSEVMSDGTQTADVTDTIEVDVDHDYSSLVVTFNYSNVNAGVTAVLYGVDRQTSYSPVSNTNGQMIFNVGTAAAGIYSLEVNGDYGDSSVVLDDNTDFLTGETENNISNDVSEADGNLLKNEQDVPDDQTVIQGEEE